MLCRGVLQTPSQMSIANALTEQNFLFPFHLPFPLPKLCLSKFLRAPLRFSTLAVLTLPFFARAARTFPKLCLSKFLRASLRFSARVDRTPILCPCGSHPSKTLPLQVSPSSSEIFYPCGSHPHSLPVRLAPLYNLLIA